MENNKQPRTIFDAINENIVSMSEDMNLMHGKVDDLLAKVNVLYNALVPAQVGVGQYAATFRVQGIISYVPCNGGCCTKSQPLSGTFTIPIASTASPTNVSIVAGATVNAIAASGCQKCSRTFVSETPLSLTVTVAG